MKKAKILENIREKNANNSMKLMQSIAKKNNIDINSLMFYDKTYAEYVADYVRIVTSKNKITNEKVLEVLNRDLTKQLQGVILGKSKEYNAGNAYRLFVDISFYIQSRLAEKYGVETYHDIESTGNIDAINEQKKFEEWKSSRIESLEKISKMSRDEVLETFSNPKEKIKSIRNDSSGMDSIDKILLLIFGLMCTGALVLIWKFEIDKVGENLNSIAQELGFDNYNELHDYLEGVGYEYLSGEEKDILIESILSVQNENTISEYGFNSLNAAMNAINAKRITTTDFEEYNINIAEQRTLTLEKVAHLRGFSSLEDAQEYLRIKMGLEDYVVGGGGPQKWTETIDVLNPQDRALKRELESTYDYFSSKIKVFEPNMKYEIINDETLNNLNNELVANEAMLRITYDRFFKDYDEYYYAKNLDAQAIGDALLEKSGADDIPDKRSFWDRFVETQAYMSNSVSGKTGSTNSTIGQVADSVVDNLDVIAIGGAGIVAGASLITAVRYRKLISAKIKELKHRKFLKMQEKIEKEKQIKEDNEEVQDELKLL